MEFVQPSNEVCYWLLLLFIIRYWLRQRQRQDKPKRMATNIGDMS